MESFFVVFYSMVDTSAFPDTMFSSSEMLPKLRQLGLRSTLSLDAVLSVIQYVCANDEAQTGVTRTKKSQALLQVCTIVFTEKLLPKASSCSKKQENFSKHELSDADQLFYPEFSSKSSALVQVE